MSCTISSSLEEDSSSSETAGAKLGRSSPLLSLTIKSGGPPLSLSDEIGASSSLLLGSFWATGKAGFVGDGVLTRRRKTGAQFLLIGGEVIMAGEESSRSPNEKPFIEGFLAWGRGAIDAVVSVVGCGETDVFALRRAMESSSSGPNRQRQSLP